MIAIIGCAEQRKKKGSTPAQEAKAGATLQLTDLSEQPISLDQYKGSTVFINFWATWCKPCIQEMPTIKNAQDILKKEGVVFLLASAETPEEINEFRKTQDPSLQFIRLINLEELNLEGLPTTFIYNPKGELVFSETGYRNWDDSSNLELIQQINNQK